MRSCKYKYFTSHKALSEWEMELLLLFLNSDLPSICQFFITTMKYPRQATHEGRRVRVQGQAGSIGLASDKTQGCQWWKDPAVTQ